MIKKFFLSFLGSMAAIWLSFLLMGLLAVLALVAVINGLNGDWKEMLAARVENNTVLTLKLSGEVTERGVNADILNFVTDDFDPGVNLSRTVNCIYRAAHDQRIRGLYITCNGAVGGVSSMQELNEAIKYFKSQPDKWVIAYADNYAQGEYLATSGAGEMWLNPVGSADIHGLSATTVFYTGLLEKLGIKMQVLRVGTFKSAVEPFMLKEPSEASRMQQKSYMTSIWNSVRNEIAANRALDSAELDRLADEFTFSMPADSLLSLEVVSKTGYRTDVENYIAELMHEENFGEVNKITIDAYATTFDETDYSYLPDVNGGSKTIAVVYAVGEIVDDGSEGIVGNKMVDRITRLTNDCDDLAGLILRVNSPGGSAFASEQIWHALQEFKQKTGLPFYVSMGDVAASGGYYISCGADVIYADSTTITGSIGIFGMIPDIQGLLNNHLGITTSTVSTNRNGNFPSLTSPMTPEQTRKMQAYVERGYDLFTKRCAEGRHMSQDSIKAIAEGRVWSGGQAMEIGLVDRAGSLRAAIAGMAADFNLSGYKVKCYPEEEMDWLDLLMAMKVDEEADEASMARTADDARALLKKVNELREAPKVQCRMEDIVIF